MLKDGAIAALEVPTGTAPARSRGVGFDPETAYAAAALSRDPGVRLLAHTLDSLTWFARAALAIAFTVDEHEYVEVTMMHCAPGHDRHDAAALIARLRQLEPVDPFSPRRAAMCRASVMCAGEVGGLEAYGRSLYGQRLRRHGYGAPLVLYLWRGERIVAGVTLLREWDAPPFDGAAIRLVRQLHPLLENAFGFAAAEAHPPTLASVALAAGLTTREAEIARLVAGGASNADIARRLDVSEATVKAHLTKVYAKLNVRSRTQLAVAMSDAD